MVSGGEVLIIALLSCLEYFRYSGYSILRSGHSRLSGLSLLTSSCSSSTKNHCRRTISIVLKIAFTVLEVILSALFSMII